GRACGSRRRSMGRSTRGRMRRNRRPRGGSQALEEREAVAEVPLAARPPARMPGAREDVAQALGAAVVEEGAALAHAAERRGVEVAEADPLPAAGAGRGGGR